MSIGMDSIDIEAEAAVGDVEITHDDRAQVVQGFRKRHVDVGTYTAERCLAGHRRCPRKWADKHAPGRIAMCGCGARVSRLGLLPLHGKTTDGNQDIDHFCFSALECHGRIFPLLHNGFAPQSHRQTKVFRWFARLTRERYEASLNFIVNLLTPEDRRTCIRSSLICLH